MCRGFIQLYKQVQHQHNQILIMCQRHPLLCTEFVFI